DGQGRARATVGRNFRRRRFRLPERSHVPLSGPGCFVEIMLNRQTDDFTSAGFFVDFSAKIWYAFCEEIKTGNKP
ncbi:MAG: hypothetical protein LUE95_03685, partial [Oscillospiraceae bacterium]|nr:hypothetical protein [Oscillospiraceae bacterium]